MSHTKGPWQVYKSGFDKPNYQEFVTAFKVGYGETKSVGPSYIASEIGPHPYAVFNNEKARLEAIEESRANACLIAAAPEMLEMLQKCLDRFNFRLKLDEEMKLPIIELLKKAKGET